MSHHWVPSSTYGALPHNAVIAGNDSDGSPIYIGRAFHAGDQIPVKVLPSKQAAYLSYGGQEIHVANYEVLTGHGLSWVGSGNGHTPNGALVAGRLANGETVYIGRAHYQGSLTPGKVHRSHGCLYIPYGGAEQSITQYEVLVAMSNKGRWDRCTSGAPVPFGAIHAGRDVDGSPLYVGKAYHEGEMIPAKITRDRAYVAHGGREHSKHDFEVLCGGNYSWVQSGHGAPVPHNAVSTGSSMSGEPLYVGRAHHNGNLTPGKVHLSHGSLYLPFDGAEVAYRDYEVLIEH